MPASPTRISELNPLSPLLGTDQIPIARGSGSTGKTYRVTARDLVGTVLKVTDTPSIDLTLDPATTTLYADVKSSFATSLSAAAVAASSTNLAGLSSTIDSKFALKSTVSSLSSTVDSKFIPKPASASNGQVLTYNGSTSTWVASALPASTGNSFTFAPRVVLAAGGPYTTSGTVASGTVDLTSISNYSTANVVQLYVKIFTNDGSPSGTYWSYLNLSVGSDSYGNVLSHSFSTNGSLPQVSQAYLLVNTSLSKLITYSLSLATATVGGISFEIAAVGKF